MLEIFLPLAAFPLALFALIAILNAFTFPRLQPHPASRSVPNPHISVLIPMRNEAAVIGQTLTSLLAQDYPHFEILLLDDNSTDHSAQAALAALNNDPRCKIIPGQKLPPGWLGKNWACQQLSQAATGQMLLFTDADVRWHPHALSTISAEMYATRADLLTVWPNQKTISCTERLVVPLMNFSIFAYLPALAVHHIPWPVFAAAIGQCLVFRRAAYQKIGAHHAIRNHITDDMAFAYRAKQQKLRFRMAQGADLLSTRMYTSWAEVRRGYAKNILAGHGGSLLFLIFSTLFHWWIFVLPWPWLLASLLTRQPASPALICILLGLLTRALSAAFSKQPLIDALFMPASVILMTLIAIQAVHWHFAGGPQWKGRTLTST